MPFCYTKDVNKYYSLMIKPASSLCDLSCKYCFYADVSSLREVKSFGIMSQETKERMLKNIFEELNDGDKLTIAFQGGEPSIAGLDWFKDFFKLVSCFKKNIKIEYAFQTNGILIDDNWAKLFHDFKVLVGISLDLLKTIHDNNRVDVKGVGTYNRVLKTIKLLDKYKVEYNVLATLTNELARYPLKVWQEIIKNDFHYIQFTPCLDELDQKEGLYGIKNERFAYFYKTIFDKWYEEFNKGNYISIKLFDDLVNLLAYNMQTACGIIGRCSPQIVIEANGSVYPCDFYCLDENCIGNITLDSLASLSIKSFNHESKAIEPLPQHCNTCKFLNMCHGNCKRMRKQICLKEKDNYCGYEDLLTYIYPRLFNIAKRQ